MIRSSCASTWRRCPSSPRMAIVIRERPGSCVVPTVSDSMLKLRARSRPDTRFSVPGRSTTSALTTWRRWTASASPAGTVLRGAGIALTRALP